MVVDTTRDHEASGPSRAKGRPHGTEAERLNPMVVGIIIRRGPAEADLGEVNVRGFDTSAHDLSEDLPSDRRLTDATRTAEPQQGYANGVHRLSRQTQPRPRSGIWQSIDNDRPSPGVFAHQPGHVGNGQTVGVDTQAGKIAHIERVGFVNSLIGEVNPPSSTDDPVPELIVADAEPAQRQR